MKIDPKALREAADAHAKRLESPLWTPSDGKQDDSWVASFTSSASDVAVPGKAPRPQHMAQGHHQEEWRPQVQPGLESIERAVETWTDAVNRRPIGSDAVPSWLETAAGNPHSYDSPDASRTSVCARVRPATYDRLRMLQQRVGLRTTAGAWEFLLRLGLAAAERLQNR